MTEGRAQWNNFLSRSLATRLDFDTFKQYIELLHLKYPLQPHEISQIFLAPTEDNGFSLDPRIPRYLQVLLDLHMVNVPSILRALAAYSTFGTQADSQSGEANTQGTDKKRKIKRWTSSYATDEMLLYKMAKSVVANGNSQTAHNAPWELLAESKRWMKLVISSAGHGDQDMLNLGGHTHVEEMKSAIIAVGTLVVAIMDDAQVLKALGKVKDAQISGIMADFVPLLAQTSPQNAARLELFRMQTLVAIQPVEKKEKKDKELNASKEIDEILGEVDGTAEMDLENMVVTDLPNINTRAGLYIYLNALLVGRPLIDDSAIFSYLHNRYHGEFQTTSVDLILASFDILANATFRNEKKEAITVLRSFLINKVPLLIASLSLTFFSHLNPEDCITQALSLVDQNAFPTLADTSAMFGDSVRLDFCFACCLHGLIQESSIEGLLGDIPMQSLPAGGRYVKENLVQQCLSDPEKAESLIDTLESMDGNVGAVSQAITEVMRQLCVSKETMSLKTLCSKLARKPICLDIMLLFDKAITILQPICELLDNWHYDEDQGEYQPVYEEFGSILLLVLSFAHRYGLSPVDMGIRSPSSFTARLLNQGHLSRAMENLTQQEQNHLDGWIRGLFDNESGGLGDELMSSCPPQDFYLLVPTLFHHIVLACSTNNLSDEGLKGGLEYLVDTFLLPSLIPGITWLSSHLWESRGDANAVLQILSALITNPANISNNLEASQMLNSILNIIAKSLEHSLRWLQRAEPARQDVAPLSNALRDNLGWERRGASDHTELESWTSVPGGGLTTALKATITALVQWSSNPTLNINPTPYTHRQVLVSLKLLTAKRVLGVILEEVKAQTELGDQGVVYDVATALICAPEQASWEGNVVIAVELLDQGPIQPLQRRMTLREALKIEAENAAKGHKSDPFTAEMVVRLYRKVEAQCVVQHPQGIIPELGTGLGGDMVGDGMDGLHGMTDAGLDAALSGSGQMGQGMDDIDMSGLMGGVGGDDLLDGFADAMGDGMGF